MASRLSLIVFAFALLGILGMMNAQTCTTTNGQTTSSYTGINATQTSIINSGINNGLFLSTLAILFALMVIAVGFMISKVVGSGTLAGLLNNEYYEVVKSIIIVVCIFLVLALLSNVTAIVDGVGVSTGATYLTNIGGVAASAGTYLCQTQASIGSGLTGIVAMSTSIGLLRSLTVSYAVPIPIGVFGAFLFGFTNAAPYSSSLLESLGHGVPFATQSFTNDLLDFIVIPMLSLVSFEIILLPELILLGLAVFIPIGLAFRAFPVFRPIGGVLIALGIGIAIIFPAVLALFNAPISSAFATAAGGAITSPANPTACSTCNWLTSTIYALFSSIFGGSNPFAPLGTAFASINNIYPALNYLLGYNLYMIFQFLLLVLDIAITITLASTIADALGGKLPGNLLGKMKMT